MKIYEITKYGKVLAKIDGYQQAIDWCVENRLVSKNAKGRAQLDCGVEIKYVGVNKEKGCLINSQE